ncbi:MAG TPA: SDR family oxidoreductase [Methylophilaceae bacterium]|nr:SDR family oxidoreductase [Methylophilaceae bacterium]
MKQNLPTKPADGSPQRVFITGASSGIGQALARHYARQGAQIGLAARRIDALQTLAAELGPQCAIYSLDVRDAAALDEAAQDFMQRFGVPDIVIANAGVSRGTLTEHKEDLAAFKAIMDINVLGMVHTFQPFIAAIKASPTKGRLVGIASVAGIRGLPGAEAYSASKAAAISYLESLRSEMSHYGIAVTTIAPGYIRTAMTDINTYRMPFLMDVDIAVQKFAAAIAAKRRFVIIPWQMGVVARLMRLIPAGLWDWLVRKAPHKPRPDWDWL